jgi:hypothetical protein
MGTAIAAASVASCLAICAPPSRAAVNRLVLLHRQITWLPARCRVWTGGSVSRAVSRPHHAPSGSGITHTGLKKPGQPSIRVSIEDIARLAGHASTRTTEGLCQRRPNPARRQRGPGYCSSISISSGASACQPASGPAWASRPVRAVYPLPASCCARCASIRAAASFARVCSSSSRAALQHRQRHVVEQVLAVGAPAGLERLDGLRPGLVPRCRDGKGCVLGSFWLAFPIGRRGAPVAAGCPRQRYRDAW